LLDFRIHEDGRKFTHMYHSAHIDDTLVARTISWKMVSPVRALLPALSNMAPHHHDYAQQG
jgi:hypothetical protein